MEQETQGLGPVEVTRGVFDGERRMAQEQIAAAWQLHVEMVQEQLERGWKEHVARALDERMDSLEASFAVELDREVGERLNEENARAMGAALRGMSERLNQTARRLDLSQTTEEWASALLDGAYAFAPRVVLFSIINGEVQYEDHRAMDGLDVGELSEARVGVGQAAAFQSVMETQDAVISMAGPNELGEEIARVLGGGEEKRVCLLPVVVGRVEGERKVAAVLYAEGGDEPVDINMMELVTALAGPALEARQAEARQRMAQQASSMVAIAPVVAMPAPAASGPEWGELSRDEQELHARAQRFARVRVAEMRLYQAGAVKKGREEGKLYEALKGEMERGRAQYKQDFMFAPGMVDYFHQELVRTLANDDEKLLGDEYPGALE